MERYFNTTGPCDPRRHYMLPPEARLPGLDRYVDRWLYFALHAARQTGKTTLMRSFAARQRALGHVALHVTFETSQGEEDVATAEARWLDALRMAAGILPPSQRPPLPTEVQGSPGTLLGATLQAWSERVAPIPVVLLIDEADTVTGPAMVNLLRQLRAGFHDRPDRFPASIALIGMRGLRDYLAAAKDGVPVNPGSPFNVKEDSLTLRAFRHDEVAALLAQHTDDTGQAFTPAAIDAIVATTRGQPFLVNAIAKRCVDDLVPDRAVPVDLPDVVKARELLIQSRTTHLDSLRWRLEDPRIKPIIRDILLGDSPTPIDTTTEDFQYALDLGLVVKGPDGPEIANPIYREVIARVLSQGQQDNLPRPWWRWQTPSGGLDMHALVDAFRAWWREHADALRGVKTSYPEAVPHLTFMAFLQRVVNGGGTVTREYAAGRERIDLLVTWADERHVIELKRVTASGRAPDVVRERGVAQLGGYLDTLGLDEGWLIVFDERPDAPPWDERLWAEDRVVDGRRLHLRGG